MQSYEYYLRSGSKYFSKFLRQNPEFNTKQFTEFVENHNKGDRDSGELQEIAKHEVLRLAYEFEEKKWRFQNVYGKAKE